MNQESPSHGGHLAPRDAREVIREIAVIGFGALAVTATALGMGDGHFIDLLVEAAVVAGSVVLEHIGWALGSYIAVLLAFYGVLFGSQITKSSDVGRTRRILGLVAELMAGALVPSLVLVVVANIDVATKVGSLALVIPVSAVAFFLAIQLGRFVVFEDELKRENAERDIRNGDALARSLVANAARSAPRVLASYGVAIALVALSVSVASPAATASMVIFVVVSLLLILMGAIAVSAVAVAESKLERGIVWLAFAGGVLLTLLFTLSARGVESTYLPGLVSGIALIAMSTALSEDWLPKAWRRFTIRGAGNRMAVRNARRAVARAEATIVDLSLRSMSPESEDGVMPAV